ncbi:MAG: hypothetical protein K940chlam9_00924 [Chlamydiae bacterium]|nr:hypothetical protein [Chlamydiota bacterium]
MTTTEFFTTYHAGSQQLIPHDSEETQSLSSGRIYILSGGESDTEDLVEDVSTLSKVADYALRLFKSPFVWSVLATVVLMIALPTPYRFFIPIIPWVGITYFSDRLPGPMHREMTLVHTFVRDMLSKCIPPMHQEWFHTIDEDKKLHLGAVPFQDTFNNNPPTFGSILVLSTEKEMGTTIFGAPLQESYWVGAGTAYKFVVCEDRQALKKKDLAECAKYIDEQVKNEGGVYVCCPNGRSRSAMAMVAYLLGQDKDLSVDAALKKIQESRSFVSFSKTQKDALEEFKKKPPKKGWFW